jgi:hypothetical protein
MRDAPRCERCGRGTLLELEMKAKHGHVLGMASCSKCEARTWTADGEPVTIDEVLRLTSGDPEFAVAPTAPKMRRRARA